MVALLTPEVDLGWKAPDFSLLGSDLHYYSLDRVAGENGLVVIFMCNHCPFVKAILPKIIRDCRELKTLGIGSAAIMSNDVNLYPDDSFTEMKRIAEEEHFSFPYLYDENQEIAKSYGAVCTPDFFGFNADLTLQYRGRLDNSGREVKEDNARELFDAMSDIAHHGYTNNPQHPSVGCSIKWKE